MSMPLPEVIDVLRRTSEGLHGVADSCHRPDLATTMRERAEEFDRARTEVTKLAQQESPAAGPWIEVDGENYPRTTSTWYTTYQSETLLLKYTGTDGKVHVTSGYYELSTDEDEPDEHRWTMSGRDAYSLDNVTHFAYINP